MQRLLTQSRSSRDGGSAEEEQKHWRRRFGANWRMWSLLWWASLLFAASLPTAIAVLVSLHALLCPSLT